MEIVREKASTSYIFRENEYRRKSMEWKWNRWNESIKSIYAKRRRYLSKNNRYINKREKKIQELEKIIRKKSNKRLFGTTGIKILISRARDELYYELKNIWYGKAV